MLSNSRRESSIFMTLSGSTSDLRAYDRRSDGPAQCGRSRKYRWQEAPQPCARPLSRHRRGSVLVRTGRRFYRNAGPIWRQKSEDTEDEDDKDQSGHRPNEIECRRLRDFKLRRNPRHQVEEAVADPVEHGLLGDLAALVEIIHGTSLLS